MDKYEEKVEQLKRMLPSWEKLSYNGKTFIQDLKHIFPELAESEDERIRKEIIDFVRHSVYSMPAYKLNERIAWLEKQCEQKPAEWSEEDNYVYNEILKRVADGKLYEHDLEYIYQWLKALKDKVQPQPQQEWSEEDKQMLEAIEALCDDKIRFTEYADVKEHAAKVKDWLKSLRPQKQWKPSEEQTKALDWVVNYDTIIYPERREIIKELLEQIKKL